MDIEEKKAYAAEASARLKERICGKLAEIGAEVSAEKAKMAECGGEEAAESILCALECTRDQVKCALNSWAAPEGAEAEG